MNDKLPANQRPGGSPYRGVDYSGPTKSAPTHDEMMEEMKCQVEHDNFPSPPHWAAKLMWMERDGARAFISARGKESTEAVRNLYDHFTRMKSEGWKRST
jgi:hypothetical protein